MRLRRVVVDLDEMEFAEFKVGSSALKKVFDAYDIQKKDHEIIERIIKVIRKFEKKGEDATIRAILAKLDGVSWLRLKRVLNDYDKVYWQSEERKGVKGRPTKMYKVNEKWIKEK